MYTTTPPTQLLCSCVRFDQGRRASQLCRCGQSVGSRWCSKGKMRFCFQFFSLEWEGDDPLPDRPASSLPPPSLPALLFLFFVRTLSLLARALIFIFNFCAMR
jgi:hypothetical protein